MHDGEERVMYNIIFNDISSDDMKVIVKERPDIPAPIRRYERTEVPGRDGSIIESDESYEDISIPIAFNYLAKEEEWAETFRRVKNWLYSKGNGWLIFQDDPDYFYKVKNVEIGTNERTSLRVGNFSVTFLCDPFQYAVSGVRFFDLKEEIYNHYDTSHPVYKIVGNGLCSIGMNGKTVKVNVSEHIILDTDRMLAYKDAALKNPSVTGKYSDLFLIHGKNEIAITKGFEVAIQPNWRCL